MVNMSFSRITQLGDDKTQESVYKWFSRYVNQMASSSEKIGIFAHVYWENTPGTLAKLAWLAYSYSSNTDLILKIKNEQTKKSLSP